MDTSSSDKTIIKVSDYHWTCDKVKREFLPYKKGDYASLGCYALNVVE